MRNPDDILTLRLEFGSSRVRLTLAALAVLACVRDLAPETLSVTTSLPAPAASYAEVVVTSSTVLNHYNGNTVLLAANPAGRVGIGTETPTVRLEVQGRARIAGGLSIGGPLTMGDQRIVGMADPAAPRELATKAYVDARFGALLALLAPR